MTFSLSLLRAFLLCAFFFGAAVFAAEEEEDADVRTATGENIALRINGLDRFRLITSRSDHSLSKPYADILTTPAGRNILRDNVEDHIHHRGLMFAVSIDEVDFWTEYPNKSGQQILVPETLRHSRLPQNNGKQHDGKQKNGKQKDGKDINFTETWTCRLDWCSPSGTKLAREDRKIMLMQGTVPDAVLVDWTSVISPAAGKESVKISGEKYHGLGMRFDQSMDNADGRFFSDKSAPPPEIVRDSEKLTVCRWTAYTSKLRGKPVTVAVFDSPDNVRKMTAFTMGNGKRFAYLSATVNLHREPVSAAAAKPAVFRYGICLWERERSAEEIEKAYQIYRQSIPPQEKVPQ